MNNELVDILRDDLEGLASEKENGVEHGSALVRWPLRTGTIFSMSSTEPRRLAGCSATVSPTILPILGRWSRVGWVRR